MYVSMLHLPENKSKLIVCRFPGDGHRNSSSASMKAQCRQMFVSMKTGLHLRTSRLVPSCLRHWMHEQRSTMSPLVSFKINVSIRTAAQWPNDKPVETLSCSTVIVHRRMLLTTTMWNQCQTNTVNQFRRVLCQQPAVFMLCYNTHSWASSWSMFVICCFNMPINSFAFKLEVHKSSCSVQNTFLSCKSLETVAETFSGNSDLQ